MLKTKRALAVVFAMLCVCMSLGVFADVELSAETELDGALLSEAIVEVEANVEAFEAKKAEVIAELEVEIAEAKAEIEEIQQQDIPGYEKYLLLSELNGIIGDAQEKIDEFNENPDSFEEYLAAEEENAAQEALDNKISTAESYIEGYADAIVADEAVGDNIKEAVAVVKQEVTPFYATIWSIIPAIIAIVLALITKEVYSSLFIGILAGGLLYANFNLETTIVHVIQDGFVASLSDSYNVGILIFLVFLGTLVAIMNKAGGSAAFGRWASKNIKSRVGAQISTIILGVLIFVDDYFNCLTVGSVMRPVCDAKKISRSKLAYLIDSTAAPICIIAPISSWAAAVAGFAPEGQGISLFIQTIPFNFYALLTIVMMVVIALLRFDYGPMKLHERNAEEKGDIFTTVQEASEAMNDEKVNEKGKVIDLVIPVIILIICCIVGMIYSGGFFSGESFIDAFSNCDASVGLAIGSIIAIIFVVVYFLVFRHGVIKFKDLMGSVPEGFKAMVPAILILTCAWTLKGMTDSIGAKVFIAEFVRNSAGVFVNFLPAIIFLIAIGLSFATGTSWGTFGILIPIVLSIFVEDKTMAIVGMSACMAGAVCGDHCSPISDTTIMASAGAQCNHVNHVNTQLPYALTVAGVSFVAYIVAGFVPNALIVLPIAVVLMVGVLFGIKAFSKK